MAEMKTNLYRIIDVDEELILRFSIEDRIHNFEGRPDAGLYMPKVQWDNLAAHYNLSQERRGWKEQILNLTNPEILESEESLVSVQPLVCDWVTSYDKTKGEPFHKLAALGVVVTRDEQVLVGVRGGEITPERIQRFGSGLYGLPAAGSVSFRFKLARTLRL